MSAGTHTHQLVYVGELQGEYGGSYPCRHCRDCGTLVLFTVGSTYEMIPEFARGRVEGSRVEMVPQKLPSKKPPERVLGRGLVELMAGAKVPAKFPGS